MALFLRAFGLWLAFTLVVGLFSIWQWQTSGVEVDGATIALQLLLLPTLLTMTWLLVMWSGAQVRKKVANAKKKTADVSPLAAGYGDGELGGSAAHQHLAGCWMVESAVWCPHGRDTESMLAAIRTPGRAMVLDERLLDHDGLPIFSGRVAAVDELLNDPDRQPVLRADGQPGSDLLQRAALLVALPLSQVEAALWRLPKTQTTFSDDSFAANERAHEWSMKAHLSGVAQRPSVHQLAQQASVRPALTVRLYVSDAWHVVDQQALLAHVKSVSEGFDGWANAFGAKEVVWQLCSASSGQVIWSDLNDWAIKSQSGYTFDLLIALSADSLIDQAVVDQMLSQGQLFTADHQTGIVPGEGAAALLLASSRWSTLGWSDEAAPPGFLCLPFMARRDKSADAIGRVGALTLESLFSSACSSMGGNHSVDVVISDADHRGSRASELYEGVQSAWPDLDPLTQVLRCSDGIGDMGVAGGTVTVATALAAIRSADGVIDADRGSVIVVLNQTARDRTVLRLAPSSAPTSSQFEAPVAA